MTLDIGLATSAELPSLDPDSQLLEHALQAQGLRVQPLVWTDPQIDWAQMRACLIRSTWDYYRDIEAYLAWISRTAEQTTLWNPAPLMRWNADKRYLFDLAEKGIPIVPSKLLNAGEQVSWTALLDQLNWPKAVFKPSISASGYRTYLLSPAQQPLDEPMLNAILAEQDVLLQPYLTTITTQGERSLIFAGGEYSHSVIKHPAQADFKVQEHFGGHTQGHTPTTEELDLSHRILDALETRPVYGRVDLVFDNEQNLCLSELELIEPSMYWSHAPQGCIERFARHLAERLVALAPL